MNHRSAARMTALVVMMVAVVVPSGLLAEPSSATVAASTPRITWKGWKGVHPGMRLGKAARKLGTSPDKSCGVYWYVKGGSGVRLTDNLTRSRRVVWIYTLKTRVHGPLGVHDGMRLSKVRARAKAAGLVVRKYYVAESGTYARWIKNPKTGTVIAMHTSGGSPNKVYWVGLTRSVKTAKKALNWQGGC